MLISTVLPILSVYRLPHGQYGYSGHIINLLQDMTTFVTSLPRHSNELDVLLVRKEGSSASHRDFRVRRSVVLRALQWLKTNNIYYKDVKIDMDKQRQLPEDGDLTGLSTVMMEMSINEDTTTEQEDPHAANLTTSFIPITNQKLKGTEKEKIRKSVENRHLPWSSSSDVPLNEFTTEGYMSCAFPTLFPTGRADFVSPRRRTVTIGNYFTHLMKYGDGQFARHPRFRYFALNTEMRWRALQMGRIYVKQHPRDARLTVEELRDMVGHEGEALSKRVVHFATSLRGTRQYWFHQRSRLISMVDTLGLPTIFFTHSAADTQWPELARLICLDNPYSSACRNTALFNNPAIADWFCHQRITRYIDTFYVGVLGATDYWVRFEWQHRGSPHVHGVAWLPDAPNVKDLTSENEATVDAAKETIIQYVDRLVSTINPAIAADGSDADQAPLPKTKPQHICNKSYTEVEDYNQDLKDLIATCQRHTRCSAAYCLKTGRRGKQECRFGYPKPLQAETTITMVEGDPVLTTKRNDPLVNDHNTTQISSWRVMST